MADELNLNKWADHLIILHAHAQGLLAALHAAKQSIDSDSPSSPTSAIDLLSKGGSPDVGFSYNGASVSPASPARPGAERLKTLGDPTLAPLFKIMVKKFPDAGDLAKSSGYPAFQSAHGDILSEMQPIYDLFLAIMEFTENAAMVLSQGINLVSFNSESNPDIVDAFLDLLVSYTFVLHMLATLGNERKTIAMSFSRAYQIKNSEAEPSFQR
ncbi:hypothetical protein BDK51DRAFT_34166, partial [Blyttiomyces helicus]